MGLIATRRWNCNECSKLFFPQLSPSWYMSALLFTLVFISFSGVSKPVISHNNFLAVYFDKRHKDLKLLLNLLAETSGLPESFRILTLFDKKFQSLWRPQNLRFEEYETVNIMPPPKKGIQDFQSLNSHWNLIIFKKNLSKSWIS